MASVDPWMSAMRRGDFEAAWRVSDRVLARRRTQRIVCTHWPRHLQFIWNGAAFDGRHVLVRCYHGLGDTLQFAQLLEPLRQRARQVTVWAQPALLGVLRGVRGIDRLLPLHDGVPEVDCDVEMESMEIAHALRIGTAHWPCRARYIELPPLPRAVVDARSFNVGIAWRSGGWNTNRSIPAGTLAMLCDVPVRWHALQFPPEQLPFESTQLACRSIRAMARRMLQLDAVVSVDTMVAHLAAAMGLPTYLLLNRHADWRWQTSRSDSPWYPSMRIFRMRTSWIELLAEVGASIAAASQTAAIQARGMRSGGCTAFSD